MTTTAKKTGTINVFGTSYVVELCTLLEGEGGENHYGETNGTDKIIRLSLCKNDTKKKLQSTLFHEIIHAALAECGLSQMLGDSLEEAVVVALENSLFYKLVEFKPHVLKKATGDSTE